MIHVKYDSEDATSISTSSPRSSPKRPLYYVESPSSHDSEKLSPVYNSSPTDSPSAYGRLSMTSTSGSRVSGTFSLKGSRLKRNSYKGQQDHRQCKMIDEEGYYGEFKDEKGFSKCCQCLIGVMGFSLMFALFCLIIWGASRPFKTEISVKSLTVHNFYFGEGSDLTGVPTKLLTVNCTLKMRVYNPATFFGVYVGSTPIHLMYSQIAVANGQIKRYYQPRKSHRMVTVKLQGNSVPLYGAGASLASSDSSGGVPMRLVFEVRTQGDVVGKLLKSRHGRQVSCSLVIDSRNNSPINFEGDSCAYN